MTEKPIDLGTFEVPEAEKLQEFWSFRAACVFKNIQIEYGQLCFGLILDLGFGIYCTIHTVLDDVKIKKGIEHLAIEFAENWAKNGEPNQLLVHTLSRCRKRSWLVAIFRRELDLETLKVIGETSLSEALIEQGLVSGV
jgi:hypothetical protein